MFLLKKLLSRLFFPVPLCGELLVAGLLVVLMTRRRRLGLGLIGAGTVLLLFFGYPWFGETFLPRIERQHAPMTEAAMAALDGDSGSDRIRYIGVLGQGVSAEADLPANARLNETMIARLIEGVRLRRLLPNATLLISLSSPIVRAEEKERVAQEFLAICGLSMERVVVCSEARDTGDEIRAFQAVAGTNRVVLVSSASHLPRALVIARREGLDAVASPCGYTVRLGEQPPFGVLDLFPSAEGLARSEETIYEHLGLAWETWGKAAGRRDGGTAGRRDGGTAASRQVGKSAGRQVGKSESRRVGGSEGRRVGTPAR